MKGLGRHTLAIGRIVVSLFVLANSGYTVVLHSCVMKEQSCCSLPATHSETTLASPLGSCCEVHVAGGVNTQLTSTEHVSGVEFHKLSVIVFLPGIIAKRITDFSSSVRSLSVLALTGAPPPVEKYVLNATFLI